MRSRCVVWHDDDLCGGHPHVVEFIPYPPSSSQHPLFKTSQHHLENLAFASLSEEDLPAHSDQAVIKAFRLAQLTIEYLLHVQVICYI